MQTQKHTLKKIMVIMLFAMVFVFGVGLTVHAQASIDFPTDFAGFSSQDLKTTIENIVRIVLGFVGIIFLLIIIAAGIIWTTSGGSEDKINRAKKMIVAAVIGLLVTLSAYSIASFIINSYSDALTAGNLSGSSGGPSGFGFALGGGILESHFPPRDAYGIARNTNITVTFKEDIDPTTVCNGGQVLESSVQILDLDHTAPGNALDTDSDWIYEDVDCTTVDNRTFQFNPGGGSSTNHLGSPTNDVRYEVFLTNAILKADGVTQAMPLGYKWIFTVNTTVDLTPPQLVSVIPVNGSLNPRNSIVQLTFSEPVDPLTASGTYNATSPFNNIELFDTTTAGGPYKLTGSYISANQYRTIEFLSDIPCEGNIINSCGEPVNCLPGPVNIAGIVTENILDMAGNQLDGEFQASLPNGLPSGDGTAGGDYNWSFDTDDTIDLSPPEMVKRIPFDTQDPSDLYMPVKATFNELIAASSVTTDNYQLDYTYTDPLCGGNQKAYWTSIKNIDTTLPVPDGVYDQTEIWLNHDVFQPLSGYCPIAHSEIRDLRQNCYNPAVCNPAVPGDC